MHVCARVRVCLNTLVPYCLQIVFFLERLEILCACYCEREPINLNRNKLETAKLNMSHAVKSLLSEEAIKLLFLWPRFLLEKRFYLTLFNLAAVNNEIWRKSVVSGLVAKEHES